MNPSVHPEPFIAAADAVCQRDALLRGAWVKVRGKMVEYAEHVGKRPSELMIMDVGSESGRILPKLESFILALQRSPGKQASIRREIETALVTEEEAEQKRLQYNGQLVSILGRVLSAIMRHPDDIPKVDAVDLELPLSVLTDGMPPFLNEILNVLPRVRNTSSQTKTKAIKNGMPLTPTSQLCLAVLRRVAEVTGLDYCPCTVEALVADHYGKVLEGIRVLAPDMKRGENAYIALNSAFRRLGFEPPKRPIRSLSLEELPHPLREEVAFFKLTATTGLDPDCEFWRIAEEYGANCDRIEENTATSYIGHLCYGMSYIHFGGEFSIKNLLETELVEKIVKGHPKKRYHNSHVDIFRSACRRGGKDGSMFSIFLDAIRRIGIHNGFAYYLEEFNLGYNVKLDLDGRQAKKDKEKEAFTLELVDGVWLKELEEKFYSIVESGSFRAFMVDPVTGGVKRAGHHISGSANYNLRLCLFFVMLLTLRVMGFRQRNIRNCKIGKNIILHPDGSITFHFGKNETKNGKALHIDLEAGTQITMHRKLQEVLHAYYRLIYPYVEACAALNTHGEPLDGQFFVKLEKGGRPSRFESRISRGFVCTFKHWTAIYLNFDKVDHEMRRALHAHFFRGLAIDWMLNVLNMSEEQVAEAVADNPYTLGQYKNRTREHNPSKHFVDLSEKIFERSNRGRMKALEAELKDLHKAHREENKHKDEIIHDVMEQSRTLTEQLAQKEADLTILRARLEASRSQAPIMVGDGTGKRSVGRSTIAQRSVPRPARVLPGRFDIITTPPVLDHLPLECRYVATVRSVESALAPADT